jgi:hypothetical protein
VKPSVSDLGRHVIHRAFAIAAATSEVCRPVHLLAALGNVESSVSAILDLPFRVAFVPGSTSTAQRRGGRASFVVMQTQGAAIRFASERGETASAEHLLLAVLDQGEPEALESLRLAGLDLMAVREAALASLGAPRDLPPMAMPPLTPAGTLDRPPLPVEQLDARAWSLLSWRQDNLPLNQVRREEHYAALRRLETRAVWRVSDKLELDDDQRYSLVTHHLERVEQRAAKANPNSLPQRSLELPHDFATTGVARGRRRLFRPRWLNFTVGWGTWLGNRRVGLRNRWFQLRTLGHFRHAPQV